MSDQEKNEDTTVDCDAPVSPNADVIHVDDGISPVAKRRRLTEKNEVLARWAGFEKAEQENMRWYYGDQQRLAEMEAYVLENNVVNFVCDKAKVTDKTVSFEELTAEGNNQPQQA